MKGNLIRSLQIFVVSFFTLTILFSGVVNNHASAHYLDGEVSYPGDLVVSHNFDGDDGTVDGICHENSDPLEPETSCGLLGDDNYSPSIPLDFSFDFYGDTFTEAYANINGTLNFDCPTSEYSNENLPTNFDGDCSDGDPGIVPAAILAFWDDIITAPKGLTCTDDPLPPDGSCSNWEWNGAYPTIVSKTVGTAGSRKFIMQWTNMYLYSNPNVPLGTFQVILYEGSNNIQIQYRNLLGDPDRSSGSSATIGIQKNLSTYSEFSFDTVSSISQGMAIRYVPDGSGGYLTADDAAAYDPVYLSLPGSPGVPVLTHPANSATNAAREPMFQWNASSLAQSYVVTVATDSGFSDVVLRQDELTETTFTPEITLDSATTYYWTVKAVNETGETFSTINSFTTGEIITDPNSDSDTDGSIEGVEEAGPNSGDANNDGTPDNTQPTVTSLVNPVTAKYAVVESSGCDTNASVSVAAPSVSDGGYTYPAGLANFSLGCGTPGKTATITLYFYGVSPANMVLRKYNSTTGTYKSVTGAVLSDVTIGGQQATKVVYSVTDGGELDADGSANGAIVDPAGLALAAVTAPRTGLNKNSVITPFAMLFVGATLAFAARKQSQL